ncbi:hypothetical protein GDO78_006087 [Eleutherodactylus coqui]|uniref:Uncharacterized protein n=1 Tax=Eleutherodactylus coqui TaxID=57060 RepID=A0A8J6KIX8_ELECQ|nr:hypothetical protein GDO78_006087 [Eleutherodactylus coqui]
MEAFFRNESAIVIQCMDISYSHLQTDLAYVYVLLTLLRILCYITWYCTNFIPVFFAVLDVKKKWRSERDTFRKGDTAKP